MAKQTVTRFKTLPSLPVSLRRSQCVVYKKELLLCGSDPESECFSYNMIRKQYKSICSYTKMDVHCVTDVRCVVADVRNNNDKILNDITLLSFGGKSNRDKNILRMYYKSVWDDDGNWNVIANRAFNEWKPLVDERNNPIQMERGQNDYTGARSLIGGSKNHLLFIAHPPKDISVFNLNTFEYINRSTFLVDDHVQYPCFISRRENSNQKKNEMLLFCKKTGLLIEYDEDRNTFQGHRLSVCDSIANLNDYAYVRVNDNNVLFFGGMDFGKWGNKVHKYSIEEDKWTMFEHTLPIPLGSGTA
ncbi:hypothetical protein RFI_32070, partial [Reticulomyxa filosa]